MAPLVWLITGTTSGIGAALLDHIIAHGDQVIASGRNVEKRLGHLKSDNLAVLDLDITAGWAEIEAQVKKAWEIFGHIDVLMNNAGVSAMRTAEEADDAFISNMFQANLFGHMHVTKAILPYFRAQGRGRIGFTSSSTAWAPLPFMSHYAASKAALSVYVESLHKEVRSLGIQCVAFECGGFPTHLGQPRDTSEAAFGSIGPAIAAYGPLFGELVGMFAADPMAHMPGDLAKATMAIVDVIQRNGMAAGRPWVVRVALGSDGMGSVRQKCEEQLKLVDEWKDISYSTDRDAQRHVTSKEMLKFTSILETEV